MTFSVNLIEDPERRQAYRARWPKTFDVSELMRGESRREYEEPLAFDRHSGSEVHDVIWTSAALFFLVSERVVSILRESGATGWRERRVELPEEVGGSYFALEISGRIKLHPERQGVRLIERPGGSFFVPVGLGVQEGEALQADFVMPESGDRWTFVSRRVADLLIREDVSNIQFEDPNERILG